MRFALSFEKRFQRSYKEPKSGKVSHSPTTDPSPQGLPVQAATRPASHTAWKTPCVRRTLWRLGGWRRGQSHMGGQADGAASLSGISRAQRPSLPPPPLPGQGEGPGSRASFWLGRGRHPGLGSVPGALCPALAAQPPHRQDRREPTSSPDGPSWGPRSVVWPGFPRAAAPLEGPWEESGAREKPRPRRDLLLWRTGRKQSWSLS